MTESQKDLLHETYQSAVFHLVTGVRALRERLRLTITELEKCRDLCDVWPQDEFEGKLVEDLPRLLDFGGRLGEMTVKEMENFAWHIWEV